MCEQTVCKILMHLIVTKFNRPQTLLPVHLNLYFRGVNKFKYIYPRTKVYNYGVSLCVYNIMLNYLILYGDGT